MSLPRELLPDRFYMVTRRCTQRQLWLVPSKLVNLIIMYCYAVAAMLSGVRLHALCAMSNHIHLVVSDPRAELPRFTHWAHTFIAKCINLLHRRLESMWSSTETNVVALEDEDVVVEKIVYCLANPTSAGLVAYGHNWPGVRTRPSDWLRAPRAIKRPPLLFSKGGKARKDATFGMVRPKVWMHLSDEELAAKVTQLVVAREQELRDERAAAKPAAPFFGAKKVKQQAAGSSPTSEEKRSARDPRIAATTEPTRAAARDRLRAFWCDYRQAYEHWRAGNHDVVYPAGSYAVVKSHGANAAIGPPDPFPSAVPS